MLVSQRARENWKLEEELVAEVRLRSTKHYHSISIWVLKAQVIPITDCKVRPHVLYLRLKGWLQQCWIQQSNRIQLMVCCQLRAAAKDYIIASCSSLKRRLERSQRPEQVQQMLQEA